MRQMCAAAASRSIFRPYSDHTCKLAFSYVAIELLWPFCSINFGRHNMSSRSPIGHASIPSCEERWRIDASHFARLVQPQLCRRCSSPTVACASQCPTVTLPSKGDGSGDGTCLESPCLCPPPIARCTPAPCLLPLQAAIGWEASPTHLLSYSNLGPIRTRLPDPESRHLARAVPLSRAIPRTPAAAEPPTPSSTASSPLLQLPVPPSPPPPPSPPSPP
jgi:hypothetical protein